MNGTNINNQGKNYFPFYDHANLIQKEKIEKNINIDEDSDNVLLLQPWRTTTSQQSNHHIQKNKEDYDDNEKENDTVEKEEIEEEDTVI